MLKVLKNKQKRITQKKMIKKILKKLLTRKVSSDIIMPRYEMYHERGEKMQRKVRPRSKLIKLRKEKGFTQEQMARLLKIERSCYSNYENGYRNPSFENILELKKILGVTDDKIFLPDNDTKSVVKGAI